MGEPPSELESTHYRPILVPVLDTGISVIAPGAEGSPATVYLTVGLGLLSKGFKATM